ncbi:hypothetical protein GCM10011316_23290 [Roseibium aquae]|uniref:Lipoprotein n=1 Tax=Roseibium aquae TaxID=1323746 RepID=A0A916TK66_9HYPH|nr:hypothetical protein [Roseibium aquae]GGB50509.1 hypothetical protein GCM10011316_23290 [Roseibium aquae]
MLRLGRIPSSLPKLAGTMALAVFLAGCQYQSADDLLFKPVVTPDNAPETYGTQFSCRGFQGPGYKGTAAGQYFDFGVTRNFSRVGCFKTQSDCQAFLNYMSGFIDQVVYSRCQPVRV